MSIPEMEGDHQNAPTAIDVVVGSAGGEVRPMLVEASDDELYLVLIGEEKVDYDETEVIFEIPIHEGATNLTSIKIEFRSEYCTSLWVSLGGGSAGEGTFHELQEEALDICPFDEPTIYIEIPAETAELIGYGATSAPPYNPVLAKVILQTHGFASCPVGECSTTTENTDVDSVHCNSEYP